MENERELEDPNMPHQDYRRYGGYNREMNGDRRYENCRGNGEYIEKGYEMNGDRRYGDCRGYREYIEKGYGMNGGGRNGDYKSYGGCSQGRRYIGDESRYYDDGLDRKGRRERVSRLKEEPRPRRNDEFEHRKGFERPIDKDTLCKAQRGSSSRYGDCDNTPSRISPWKMDTSHPIVAPKSSCDSTFEKFEKKFTSLIEKPYGPKSEDLGYEAKEECKSIEVLPTLSSDMSPMEYDGPSTKTFHIRCKVEAKTCLMIIDGGSGANMVSERLVSKLSLRVFDHLNRYTLRWLGETGDWMVRSQVMVPIKVGEWESEVLCDVVPMNICHVLLEKP